MSITDKILAAVYVLSSVVTVGVAVLDEKYRILVMFCVSLSLVAAVLFIIGEIRAAKISRDEADRNRILLAHATDASVQTWSPRRTAIGCYTLETSITENFLELLARLRGQLEEIGEIAQEAQTSPREPVLRNLNEKIKEVIHDQSFIASGHQVFLLLLEHSRRSSDWERIRDELKRIGGYIVSLIEIRITQALTRPGDEDSEDRRDRRSRLMLEVATIARDLAGQIQPVSDKAIAIRDAARADLLRVL